MIKRSICTKPFTTKFSYYIPVFVCFSFPFFFSLLPKDSRILPFYPLLKNLETFQTKTFVFWSFRSFGNPVLVPRRGMFVYSCKWSFLRYDVNFKPGNLPRGLDYLKTEVRVLCESSLSSGTTTNHLLCLFRQTLTHVKSVM